jgi:hypothetical protein
MSRATKIQLRLDRFPELKGIDDEVEKALQEKQRLTHNWRGKTERIQGALF